MVGRSVGSLTVVGGPGSPDPAPCGSVEGLAMSQTTVLERRHSIRRGDTRPGEMSVGDGLDSPGVRARRKEGVAQVERRRGMERREYVPRHHITLGPVVGSGGWLGAVCSCGEHTLSKVEALIESWARWHRSEVIAQRSSFVHSS